MSLPFSHKESLIFLHRTKFDYLWSFWISSKPCGNSLKVSFWWRIINSQQRNWICLESGALCSMYISKPDVLLRTRIHNVNLTGTSFWIIHVLLFSFSEETFRYKREFWFPDEILNWYLLFTLCEHFLPMEFKFRHRSHRQFMYLKSKYLNSRITAVVQDAGNYVSGTVGLLTFV